MKKYFPFIVAAFILGVFLRVWQLPNVPVALFGDEIDVGLQAHSIAQTGKDYLGNRLPVMFHSFSEYRLPMQLYMDVPFIKIFGLNEIGVRGPAVVMGLVGIIALYLLAKELFGKRVAIIASLFMTFSPWHFNFSRQANDAGILLPFILFGTLFFIKGSKEYKYLILSAVAFALSLYAYAISALFTPMLVLILFLLFRKSISSYGTNKLALVGVVGVIILAPYIYQTALGRTRERFSSINVFSKKEIAWEVERQRNLTKGPLDRLFYNKATLVLDKLFAGYTQALSASFLFSKGDPNLRHTVSEFGQMYHFDVILVSLGLGCLIYFLVKAERNKKKSYLFIIAWLLVAPLPSIMTQEGGTHAARLILMLPALIVISALGFDSLLKLPKVHLRVFLLIILGLFMIFDAAKFMNRYFVVWPRESWRFWHYGFKETLNFVKTKEQGYSRIYFNNTYEPMLPRFLFWYGYDMNLFQRQFEKDIHIPNIAAGFDGFKLGDRYYFGDLIKPIEPLAKPGTMVVASAQKDATNPGIFDNKELNLLDVIYSPNGDPIFYIFTGKP